MRIQPSAYLVAVIAAIQTCMAAAADEASHQSAQEMVRAFQACARETDGARRLECYDRAMKRPTDQPALEQRFGLSPAQVLQKEHVAEAPKEMTAQIVAVQRPPLGALMLTLSNGQEWIEEAHDRDDVSVSVGDTVTVTHEMFGGFLLTSSASGHRSIRVKRVK